MVHQVDLINNPPMPQRPIHSLPPSSPSQLPLYTYAPPISAGMTHPLYNSNSPIASSSSPISYARNFYGSGLLLSLEQALVTMGVYAKYHTRPEHCIEVRPGYFCIAQCDLHVIPELAPACEAGLSSRSVMYGEESYEYIVTPFNRDDDDIE